MWSPTIVQSMRPLCLVYSIMVPLDYYKMKKILIRINCHTDTDSLCFYSLVTVTKYLTVGFILVQSLRIQLIMVGKIWQQELEAIDHIVPIVRKQREMSVSTQLAFSFFFSQGLHPMGCCCPHLGWDFSFQLT